jgi:thioesterase domain-containing protein
MRKCQQCGESVSTIRHIFRRDDFCSKKCLETYNRALARWLSSPAQRVDDIESRGVEPTDKAVAKAHAMKLPHTSKDEAHEVLWTGILGAAKHLGKRKWQPTKRQSSVVQLKKGAGQTPVYFIGMGVAELRVAQLICSDCSIFGIEIPWPSAWRNAAVKNDVDALPTMDQLAAPYVAALSVHAGSSRCVLVGHSFNGLVAFHAAHQLNEQGSNVEMVMLLDTETKDLAPHQVAWQLLQQDWGRAPDLRLTDRTSRSIASRLRSSWSVTRWMLVKEMRGLGRRIVPDRGVLTTRLDDLGIPWHWEPMKRVCSNVVRSYRLRCLDCRGVLFRSESGDESFARSLDVSLGWSNLFKKGLEIVQVTGNHDTITRAPHDRRLARAMSKILDRRANVITPEWERSRHLSANQRQERSSA